MGYSVYAIAKNKKLQNKMFEFLVANFQNQATVEELDKFLEEFQPKIDISIVDEKIRDLQNSIQHMKLFKEKFK